MDYRLSQQASLTFYSCYQLLYGRESMLLSALREKLDVVVNLDDFGVWAAVL